MDEDSGGGWPSPRVPVLLATTTMSYLPLAPPKAASRGPTTESRGFRWEADMTARVVEQVGRLHPRSRVAHLVVGEVPAAVGIADVVAVSFDPEALRHRLAGNVGPLLSPLRVRTLDALRDQRPYRVRNVARKVGSNGRALLRSTLAPLAELGLVELSAHSVRSTGAWRRIGAQLTAVELKLSKWRDALRQADNFALSADRAWVVLDEKRAKSAIEAAGHFARFGVGLAVLGLDGRLRIVQRPRGRRPERWLRALMAERAWAVAEAEVAAIAA